MTSPAQHNGSLPQSAPGDASSTVDPGHPVAEVPDPLLDDPAAERRWRSRFSASRMSLPTPARDAPGRALYVSNESGTFELYCWEISGNLRLQAESVADATTSVHAKAS